MTDTLSPELQARCVALIKHIGGRSPTTHGYAPIAREYWEQARAIVAELPKSIDPDLLEARAIYACDIGDDKNLYGVSFGQAIRRGVYDGSLPIRCALAAVKRGRSLEREGK